MSLPPIYHVILPVKHLANVRWRDGEVSLHPVVSEWLEANKCWDGLADRGFSDICGYELHDLRPLERWTNMDNEYLHWEFNHPEIGVAFKKQFSSWQTNMIYGVEVYMPSHGATGMTLKRMVEINMWLSLRDLEKGRDYFAAPSRNYADDIEHLYEFTDRNLALLFKLTWGGR